MIQDTPTKRALDALADLLLTGPAPAIDLSRPAKPDAASLGREDEASGSPDLRLTSDLGAEAPAHAPVIEAVMLGHLPGYASPWISQYAHELAARHHGAALIRLDDKQARIEVFDGTSTPGPAEEAPADEPLITALCRVAASVGAWIVVIDPPDAPVSRRRLAEMARWTILTGSDEAAVVAGYRLVKTLVDRKDITPPAQGVGFMFMGCDEHEAASAMARIERATEQFLRVPVELVGVRKQMQPARRSYVGNFESAEDPWSTLVEFFHDLTTTADQPLAAAPMIEPPLELHLTEDEPAVIEPPVQPVIAAAAPAPLPKPAAQPAAAAAPQRLSDYVNLMPLKARCPRHPEVELAMDDTGTIHLLMQANADDVDGALRTLDETRRWTMEHRELIALTVPQRTASGGEPVTHLFTDEPKRAADFALASPAAQRRMKLHLLKPVIVSGLSVNVHAEIL